MDSKDSGSQDETKIIHNIKDSSIKNIPIPSQIGPYRVKGILKKGGTSILYLGTHPDSEELIALKVLLPKYLSHPEMIGLFLKEARIIEMANHPNIVKLYGHGKWEGGLYIAMEFVQGINLKKLILQNILSFKRSLEIILEIASALSHLHNHSIIHRDLKPDNILLSDKGCIKVVDFGIARLMDEPKILKDTQLVGTPSYMSPEQKENRGGISYPTDIYSLALITNELCMGKLSYGVLHLSKLPKGLRLILEKALKPAAKDRFAHIDDFIEALNCYLNQSFENSEELLDLPLTELAEFYKSATYTLRSEKNPFSNRIDLYQKTTEKSASSQTYCEYLDLGQDNLGIMLAWPEENGVSAIFNSAVLKGMVQGLSSSFESSQDSIISKTKQFLEQLNKLIIKDKLCPFSCCFLVLSPLNEMLHYFMMGDGYLFIESSDQKMLSALSSENSKLGVDKNFLVQEISNSWHVLEKLYFFMPQNKLNFSSENLQKLIKMCHLLSFQKQTATICDHINDAKVESPLLILSILRKS